MKITIPKSERTIIFSFFITIITIGAVLLYLPVSWSGEGRLTFLDALFTSVSAVCVTGLITVDTALYSRFGQAIILLLIQLGGLGLISFSTLYLAMPRSKKSFQNVSIIKKYSIDMVEHKVNHIVRNIVLITLSVEIVGALILYPFFIKNGQTSFFNALFHSISAFCNAGFSLNSDSLVSYQSSPFVLITIMLLIVSGGLGFVVIHDVIRRVSKRSRHISLHSRIVLWTTGVLIVFGALAFFILEKNHTFSQMSTGTGILNAFFQSVTTRTAGFNAVDQAAMSTGGKLFTVPLMFIGGSPSSIAGGIKVTTFAIVMISVFKGLDYRGEIKLGNRKLSNKTITNAHIFIIKGLSFAFLSIIALAIVEADAHFSFVDIVFEVFSALGTVGLSLGITSSLSVVGKIIIIFTMFAGRVGLITMAIPIYKSYIDKHVEYPVEEVLIG